MDKARFFTHSNLNPKAIRVWVPPTRTPRADHFRLTHRDKRAFLQFIFHFSPPLGQHNFKRAELCHITGDFALLVTPIEQLETWCPKLPFRFRRVGGKKSFVHLRSV